MAAGYLGTIEAFVPATEEWGRYIDRFQQFLVVNDVKDAKKQAACLITVIGASTYKLLKNLVSPEKPTTKKLDELIHTRIGEALDWRKLQPQTSWTCGRCRACCYD